MSWWLLLLAGFAGGVAGAAAVWGLLLLSLGLLFRRDEP